QVFRRAAQTSGIGHSRRGHINFGEKGRSGGTARVNLCALLREIGRSGRADEKNLAVSAESDSERIIRERECDATSCAGATQIGGERQRTGAGIDLCQEDITVEGARLRKKRVHGRKVVGKCYPIDVDISGGIYCDAVA